MSGSFDFHALVKQTLGDPAGRIAVEPRLTGNLPPKTLSAGSKPAIPAQTSSWPSSVATATVPRPPAAAPSIRIAGEGEVIIADEHGRCGADRKGPPYMWTRVGGTEWIYAKLLPPP